MRRFTLFGEPIQILTRYADEDLWKDRTATKETAYHLIGAQIRNVHNDKVCILSLTFWRWNIGLHSPRLESVLRWILSTTDRRPKEPTNAEVPSQDSTNSLQ